MKKPAQVLDALAEIKSKLVKLENEINEVKSIKNEDERLSKLSYLLQEFEKEIGYETKTE